MFSPINTLYFQLAISLATAVVTALLTVWLALNRFYREKWWEARMRAYTDIIQALHHMKRDVEARVSVVYEDQTVVGRSGDHQAAWADLRKYIDLGEFLISPRAVMLLRKLSEECEWSPAYDYVDHLETSEAAVKICLSALKRVAQDDLQIRR